MYRSIRVEDGLLAPNNVRDVTSSLTTTPRAWTEKTVQHLLTLNPELLGVGSCLPVIMDGKSTAVCPDQLFVDELGRFTVVEVKNERAGMPAMAQLIAYASMWSTWPRPEIERSIEELAGKGSCAKVLADSHKSLLAWAGFSAPTTSSVSGRVGAWPLWPENTYEPVRERARRSWGKHALSMPTLPPRLVLMAPAFAQEAIELANQLATRMVDIELVRVELAVSEEGPVAQFETVVGPAPNLRPVYDAAVRLSRIDVISSNFEASGWAEEISSSAFALYCSSAPAAKIYLEWTPTGLTIFTCVPDKWDGPHGRKKLRKDFLAALPAGHGGDRFLTWKFNLPEEELLLDSVAAGIASAIVSTLAPVGRLSKPT